MTKNAVSEKNACVLRLMKFIHYTAAVLLAYLIWRSCCDSRLEETMHAGGMYAVFYAVIYYLLGHIYRIYDLGYARVMDLSYSHVFASMLCNCIMYAGNCMFDLRMLNPLPFAGIILLQCLMGVLWSYGANKMYYKMNAPKRTVVVYRNRDDLRRLKEIRNFSYRFKVEGYIENPDDDYSLLLEQLKGYEAVFVVGVHATLRNSIVKYCAENDVYGYIAPHISDIIIAGGMQNHTYGIPISEVRRAHPRWEYLVLKRAFDVFASIVGLVVVSPVMLATALAIKLYDQGDIFYRQQRLTKDGKLFTILKFRSMRSDAEKDGVARLAAENDDRITPVGRLIRACRIDELPQLINIIKGDMSLVGPRPERPEIAAEYEKNMPAFNLRLQAKAGLTGYAQVYGRYNTEPYDKLQMDLIYISRMSVAEDLRVLFATVKVLFMKESTEGFKGELIKNGFTPETKEKSA